MAENHEELHNIRENVLSKNPLAFINKLSSMKNIHKQYGQEDSIPSDHRVHNLRG